MRIAQPEGHMPEECFVLVVGIVQLNLVVLSVGEHDMKYAFGGPNGIIVSPQGEAEGAS